jgi:hypothetical protein
MSYIGNSSTLYDPTRSSPKTAQVFSGNGSTTTFNLTYGVATSSDIQVMVENVVQQPDYAYTATGQVLTFSAAPNPGTNNIYVVYNRTAGLTGSVSDGSISSSKLANNIRLLATDQFLGTGSTTQFALSDIPADANSLIVSINGVLQAAPANYTIAGNILTFSSTPLLNENIIIRNVGFRTTQTLYALGANTPIVQPVITGGSHTLAGTLTATGNVSLLNASGASYTANIGGTTGNLIVQSANNISVQVGGNTSATFTPTGITANLNGYVANTNITGVITTSQLASGALSAGGNGQAFTSTGTFTIPTGITRVKVTVVGAGGGGAGGYGGGGGGGGTAIAFLTGLVSGNTLLVSAIGAGGNGSSGLGSGSAGGTSTVASGTQTISTISASGGSGGTGGSSSNPGGIGGIGSGGTVNIAGQGGGGYANSGSMGGTGGSSTMGGGGIGSATGSSAQGGYGGGGGAAGNNTGQSGGNGAQGIVIFEW